MNTVKFANLAEYEGKEITLWGWVHRTRVMGQIMFLDLRNAEGILQGVIDKTIQVVVGGKPIEANAYQILRAILKHESVVFVRGILHARSENFVNKKISSGAYELHIKKIEILNTAKEPPFELTKSTADVNEEIRLRYRYLDLRTERMHNNLLLRTQVINTLRTLLTNQGFLEIETPVLTKGTPEGAREYIVPSRLYPGEFYVLPQSPQQFKQLLMVAGFERYFQIARCFRDEDQRKDRQPEFTQLDIEMSFVDQEEILKFGEKLITDMVKIVAPEKTISSVPWPRLTYKEAMEKYGSDKPDLRKDKNDPNELAFAWVLDFPMFEKLEDGTIQAAHHPFTTPNPEDIHMLESDPLKVRAWAYDIVSNGYEISSGSIRIHDRELQNRIFKVFGLRDDEIQKKFGHMLEAFEYGAPPHGGFAPGIDRLVAILANEPSIREVMAFPKTGDARDLLMGAPSPLPNKALRDVHIALKKQEK